MFKFLLIVLALIGAGLYFPSTRPVILETAKPALDPVLTWNTRSEMNRILRDLEQTERTERRLPNRGEQWDIWVRKQYQGGDATRDAWGTLYIYDLTRTQYSLTSYGADGTPGSEDDIRMVRQRLIPGR